MSDVRRCLVELRLDVVVRAREVGERARGEQLIERAAAGLHLGHLVLGALHGGTGVAHGRRDATHGFGDVRRGFGRRVGRLDGLFLRAEGFDLGLERWRVSVELLFLVDDLACWVSRSFSWAAMASRRVSASRARGSLFCASAALACSANLSPWLFSCSAWISMRLRAVATSATARLTLVRLSSCCS